MATETTTKEHMTTTTEPPTPTANISDLLAELRSVIDERERLSEQDSRLSKRKSAIEFELLGIHAATGLESLSGNGMGVTFKDDAMRARYAPEQWNAIAKWAAETGNMHIIQRRLSDAKIVDLVMEGVQLPEGLTLETYTSISTRRK